MDKNHIDMTATEIGHLWSIYQAETLNYCLLTYFSQIVEDPEIKQMNIDTLEACKKNINALQQFFQKEKMPTPIGFTEGDVFTDANKLFTDPFILYFQWFVNKGNMNYSSAAINTIAREDIFEFFENYTTTSLKLLKKSRGLLLSKGLWSRAPYIPVPQEVEFVKKQSFLNGWFGDERPLTGIEIGSIFYNTITNSIGMSLMEGFLQVTEQGEVHDYFNRGKEIASKHLDVLSKLLKKEDLPITLSWNAGISDSTEPPFSEKLMVSLITFLNAQGISNYGIAISNSSRRDVGIDFTRLAAEVAKYAEDGTNILIKNGWLESPPQAKKRLK